MLQMPLKRYLPASLFAAFAGRRFLAPGWIFGASYDAVAAVADRLALVLGRITAWLALVWASVLLPTAGSPVTPMRYWLVH